MEVKRQVEQALGNGLTESGERGFFHFDRLALGQDLHLSDVYSVVEGIEGVDHALAKAFFVEGAAAATLEDRVAVLPDVVASGGDPADATIGILRVHATGGIV